MFLPREAQADGSVPTLWLSFNPSCFEMLICPRKASSPLGSDLRTAKRAFTSVRFIFFSDLRKGRVGYHLVLGIWFSGFVTVFPIDFKSQLSIYIIQKKDLEGPFKSDIPLFQVGGVIECVK